ncbi:MAG: hypothetical protein QXI33_01510 [Candidatus Pacearchaeota archaeon]
MEVTIIVRTEKKNNSKQLDNATDMAINIGDIIYRKYGLKACKCKCGKDFTSLILKK